MSKQWQASPREIRVICGAAIAVIDAARCMVQLAMMLLACKGLG
jgi:hypothetical protein